MSSSPATPAARLLRRLHWVSVPLVVFQYLFQAPLREAMVVVADEGMVSAGQFALTTLHAMLGLGLLGLVAARLWLRRRHGGLLSPASWAARWVQGALYLALVLMALSGAARYFLGLEALARWHALGKWALAGLIGLHLIGAVVHFWRRRQAR